MLRGDDAWFGDEVAAGEPIPLRQLTRNFELDVQLAIARAQELAEGALVPSPGAERWPAAPAPEVEPRAVLPGLGDVPPDAQIHIVGVYEGEGGAAPAGSTAHPVRNVRVRTRASSRPMVLVLTSYEPVNWVVTNSGARIAAVLLGGYYTSTVTGVGNANVLRIGRAYAYEPNSDQYARLRTGRRPVHRRAGGPLVPGCVHRGRVHGRRKLSVLTLRATSWNGSLHREQVARCQG